MDMDKYLRVRFMVEDELRIAETYHPEWPKDVVHGAAVVAEEAGELVQAALDATYHCGNMAMVCSWLSGRLLLNAVRNPLLDQFMFKVRWYRRKFYLCRVDGLPDIQVDQSVFLLL